MKRWRTQDRMWKKPLGGVRRRGGSKKQRNMYAKSGQSKTWNGGRRGRVGCMGGHRKSREELTSFRISRLFSIRHSKRYC